MKVVALAGGTGSAKLLRGLRSLPIDLTAIVNVGDNFWTYGAYVCPDLDIAAYTLAGMADHEKGWGIEGDTFQVLDALKRAGAETWFKLGDRDLSTCLLRTQMLRDGATLTEATERIRLALGVGSRILPVTDSEVETRVRTPEGELHLQEFWVREGGRPGVVGVKYKGARAARVTPEAKKAVMGADRVVVCPANPVTSIGPMLAVPGFVRLLAAARARTVALSPMVGRAPVSGPAGRLMKAQGGTPDSLGVARLYSKFLDGILISSADSPLTASVKALGMDCVTTDTLMRRPGDEIRLAEELLEL